MIAAHAVAAGTHFGLELCPLIGGHDPANAEEHFGVGFFKFGTGVGDFADLGERLGGVGRISVEHGLKQNLLFFETGLYVDELDTALLEDIVHTLLLIGGEREFGDQVGVLPPHARRGDAGTATHPSAHGRVWAAAAWRTAGEAAALGDGKRSRGDGQRSEKQEASYFHVS
jgi:hypothetical protein